jgi:hypothetical protein
MTPNPISSPTTSPHRQHGAVSRRQAVDLGLTRHQIAGRLTSRRWRLATPGVYLVTAVPETWQQRVMVACLASLPGAVASHLTAAALLGLTEPPESPHVTVVRGANHRLSGAVVHRVRQTIASGDLSTVDGIPSTSAARTLVDCAGELDYDGFCELLDTAIIRRLTTSREVRAAAGRAAQGPGRKGLSLIDKAPTAGSWPRSTSLFRRGRWFSSTTARSIMVPAGDRPMPPGKPASRRSAGSSSGRRSTSAAVTHCAVPETKGHVPKG